MPATLEQHTRESDKQALAERVLMRSEHLDPLERALVEQVYERGVPLRQIALVRGCSVRTIQRRIAQLSRRLTHPQVEQVLRQHRHWPTLTARIAMHVWVRGCSMRETAQRLDLTLHQVRMQVQIIRGLLTQPPETPHR